MASTLQEDPSFVSEYILGDRHEARLSMRGRLEDFVSNVTI